MPNRGPDTRSIEALKHQECQALKGKDAPGRDEHGAERHSPRNMMKDMGSRLLFIDIQKN